MKIRFLRDCKAPQAKTRYCCEICGHVPNGKEMTDFLKGEEAEPELWDQRIDLSGLTYRVDYDIIEYP